MVLQVSFDDFADTVRRVLGDSVEGYVSHFNGVTVATASLGETRTVVAATTSDSVENAKGALEREGMRVFNGRWTDDIHLEDEGCNLEEMYIAGVSYVTESGPPGIWMDAYPALPTQVQVLKEMYDEMVGTGESADVSFDEFVRMSNANVVIASPTDLRSYLGQKGSE
jgi:hypothetical protein